MHNVLSVVAPAAHGASLFSGSSLVMMLVGIIIGMVIMAWFVHGRG